MKHAGDSVQQQSEKLDKKLTNAVNEWDENTILLFSIFKKKFKNISYLELQEWLTLQKLL